MIPNRNSTYLHENKTSNVFIYLRPILGLSRLLGVHPFDERLLFSYRRAVHSAVTCCLLLGLPIVMYVHNRSLGGVSTLFDTTAVLLGVYAAFFLVVSNACMISHLRDVINRLHSVDMDLWALGTVQSYNKRAVLFQLLRRNFAWISICVIDAYTSDLSPIEIEGISMIFSFYYSCFITNVVQLQFLILADMVGSHFEQLTKMVTNSWPALSKSNDLKLILQVHSNLCDACDSLESWFSPQSLVACTLLFVTGTMNLYAVVEAALNLINGRDIEWQFALVALGWVIVRVYDVWRLADVTSHVQKEADRLGDELSRLIITSRNKDSNDFLEVHFAKQPAVCFTAFGYFKIDYTLLHGMLAAAATYISIIIQLVPRNEVNSIIPVVKH